MISTATKETGFKIITGVVGFAIVATPGQVDGVLGREIGLDVEIWYGKTRPVVICSVHGIFHPSSTEFAKEALGFINSGLSINFGKFPVEINPVNS